MGSIIAKYAMFADVNAYNTWWASLGLPQGDTRYTNTIVSLVNPGADLRVIVKIDSAIDVTNLTVWSYKDAMSNGFTDPKPYIAQQIREAKAFGSELIVEVGAENVALGLTREQIGQMSADMFSIQLAVESGSLILARDLLAVFPPADYLTQERRDTYVAKIDAFLAEL